MKKSLKKLLKNRVFYLVIIVLAGIFLINRLNIHRWSTGTIEEIADVLHPKLQGWINYYGKYRKWVFLNVFRRLSYRLMKWVQNKYKITSTNLSYEWLRTYQKAHPNLFAHWRFGFNE